MSALASLGVALLQERRRARSAEKDAFDAAAQIVLSKGLTIIDRANLLSAVVRSESTPLAGFSVLLRLREPANRTRLMDALLADQEEIRFAGAHVVLHADQETVILCNRLLKAAAAVAQAILPVRAQSVPGFFREVLMGLPPADSKRIREATASLSEARRDFANHLRTRQALPLVDVYATSDSPT